MFGKAAKIESRKIINIEKSFMEKVKQASKNIEREDLHNVNSDIMTLTRGKLQTEIDLEELNIIRNSYAARISDAMKKRDPHMTAVYIKSLAELHKIEQRIHRDLRKAQEQESEEEYEGESSNKKSAPSHSGNSSRRG